jgi:hypothetical protein
MRTLIAVALITVVIASAQAGVFRQTSAAGLSSEDRANLLAQLTKSKQDFIDSIKTLNDTQWRFKPGPFKWSVSEAAEHIILSEDLLFNMSQGLLKSPAQPRPATTINEGDQKLLARLADRDQKAMNPDALAPKDRFKTPAEAIAEFSTKRDRLIEYVKTTHDDLRVHLTPPGPRGQLDAYQYLLLLSAHSARHTAQIKEVEANPHYPSA